MDPFLIFLIAVISLLTLVLLVVGIQVILILRSIQKTLSKANQTIETAEYFFHNITNPLTDVKALGNGVKTGLQVAESIVGWVKQRKESSDV